MKYSILSVLTVAALFTAISFSSTEAKAQSPLLSGGCGGYLGGGFNGGLYGAGRIPVPPYFAIHPPVYYSVPVPRPYGYSPYALLPGMEPVETVAMPQPEEILNPYVEEETEATEASASGNVAQTPQPKWILNPFVDHSAELATLPVVE